LNKDPGKLTITTQDGGFSGSNTDYENLFLIDCRAAAGGSFQLTTCISFFKPVANWNQAGLICYNDDDNYLKFVYEWQSSFGARMFTVGIETKGRAAEVHFRAHQGLDSVWLRVTKRGKHYTFSTSLEGRTFLPTGHPAWDSTGLFQGRILWGDGSVRQVGLFANNGSDTRAPEIDASFDFFEVRSFSDKGERPKEAIAAHKESINVETP